MIRSGATTVDQYVAEIDDPKRHEMGRDGCPGRPKEPQEGLLETALRDFAIRTAAGRLDMGLPAAVSIAK